MLSSGFFSHSCENLTQSSSKSAFPSSFLHQQDELSTANFQKRMAMLEQDMRVHEERVQAAQAQSQQFAQANHYDKDQIAEREAIVVQKFQALQVSGFDDD